MTACHLYHHTTHTASVLLCLSLRTGAVVLICRRDSGWRRRRISFCPFWWRFSGKFAENVRNCEKMQKMRENAKVATGRELPTKAADRNSLKYRKYHYSVKNYGRRCCDWFWWHCLGNHEIKAIVNPSPVGRGLIYLSQRPTCARHLSDGELNEDGSIHGVDPLKYSVWVKP